MTHNTDPAALLAKIRAARASTSTPAPEPLESVASIERELFGSSSPGDYDRTAEILAGGTIDAAGDTTAEDDREAQQEAARDAAARREASYEEVRKLIAPPSTGNPLDPFDMNRHILREAGLIDQLTDTDQH